MSQKIGRRHQRPLRRPYFRKQTLEAVAVALMLLSASIGDTHPAAASVLVVDRTDDTAAPAASQCTVAPNDCSLRGAISNANINPDADVITLPAGVYTLTLPETTPSSNADGDLSNTYDLTINGAGAGSTVIDGNGAVTGSGVIATGSNDVTFNDLTITGGAGTGVSGGGTITLVNCVVSDNDSSSSGGGIYAVGNLTLDGTDVTGNSSAVKGGGIAVSGASSQLVISDSLIDENHVSSDNFVGGGIAYTSSGVVAITNTVISNNEAAGGAGIGLSGSGAVYLTDVTVDGNYTNGLSFDYGGGGIYLNFSGTVDILRGAIMNNQAEFGGGLNIFAGTVTIGHSTLSGNSATLSYGGAIYNSGSVSVSTSTISGNSAGIGGGIYQFSGTATPSTTFSSSTIAGNDPTVLFTSTGTMTLLNSILAGTSGDQCGPSPAPFTSLGHNLSTDASCNLVAAGDLPSTEPTIGPLQDNGGTTLTHALLPGSPAVDAADGIYCGSTDQRGVSRPIGPGCDIGAFEAPLWTFLPLIVK